MSHVVDILEARVAAAVQLITSLRSRADALEHELELTRSSAAPTSGPTAPHDTALPLDELERLRAERSVVRERLRELIKEIDRVSW